MELRRDDRVERRAVIHEEKTDVVAIIVFALFEVFENVVQTQIYSIIIASPDDCCRLVVCAFCCIVNMFAHNAPYC